MHDDDRDKGKQYQYDEKIDSEEDDIRIHERKFPLTIFIFLENTRCKKKIPFWGIFLETSECHEIFLFFRSFFYFREAWFSLFVFFCEK